MENTLQTQEDVAETNLTTSGFQFRTPADIQDFSDNPAKQEAMNQLWSANLDGFTQQGMLSNPWNTINTPSTTNYYNPVQNNPSSDTASVQWSAFPGRLAYNYPTATQASLNQMADTGVMPAPISDNPCGDTGNSVPYFPYGPRGWQDEYCEWAVTRNAAGKITRIDFTCENPEYWNSLWLIDPNKVLALYQSILGKPQITLADLSVPNITDPITQGPVYNPLNIWNSGPVSSATQGGAIHLTSTPNTLQTEIGLATAATVQRINADGSTSWPSSQYNALLCDAQYGQKHRNSDPNIGGTVNSFVTLGNVVTLADPPGLYIQMPNFAGNNYEAPNGDDPAAFWTIVRGSETLDSQDGTQLPGNFILHAVYEVPANKGYTVSDITINGSPIEWGSQVAATFKMQIVASAYEGTKPAGYGPVDDTDPAHTFAQPIQLFYESYFNQVYNTSVPNPVDNPISLLSNSTFIPPTVFIGASSIQMVLICGTITYTDGVPSTYPTVSFTNPGVTATVTAVQSNVYYAVPGNSKPSENFALYLTVAVSENASAGVTGVYVTNQGQVLSQAMPALLSVLPITVQAAIEWQNTGVQIEPSSLLSIAYVSGLWTANPQDNNGQLYNANGTPSNIPAKAGYTMPGQNEGSLIGKVGDTVFFVGMGTNIPPNLSGELLLCINDDLSGAYGQGFADNEGSIIVQVNSL
ncbi:hypothetical protein VB264_22905 [Arcicella aquatica]|uniref:Uncharacterized protein n=1 Tax=Arcicella aquatica TaxID=217141 RepID=A0ABU5QU87_9BACT|nr:hypothetical protein [Arcicella aquatica]MEA5260666.1 hypothetical protein [Arcicella aquatica]